MISSLFVASPGFHLYLTCSFSAISYFGSFMDRSLAEMIDIVAADPENDLARNRLDDRRAEASTDPAGKSLAPDF
jgi:hypothetical protein